MLNSQGSIAFPIMCVVQSEGTRVQAALALLSGGKAGRPHDRTLLELEMRLGMRLLNAKHIRPSGAFITFAAFSLCSLALFPLKQARAVTPVEADTAFKAMNALYWDPVHKLFRKEELSI
jgi:hypothetical protein